MTRGFYTRLAWTGIQKNRQLYYPYFLSGIVMVMVFYIFHFLATSEVVHTLPGKAVLPYLFYIGEGAVGLFSIPFLFYTNASLIRKRKRELGLYNILGMNKRNIASVLFRETVISYGIVVVIGTFGGFLFSKIAELVLVNIMGRQVDYSIYVDWKGALVVLVVFAVIYLMILANALWQIHANNPIELLHSDSQGERPPKSHMFLTVLSFILIGAGYCAAADVTAVEYQLAQIFVTVVLLIAGTFLLFICAFVALCRILQNRKTYYYQTSHFVTISTMAYRMKRSGASLAAICVLVTLVLVACSFSVSFYAGSMEVLQRTYPYDLSVRVEIPPEKIGNELAEGTCTEGYRAGIDAIISSVMGSVQSDAGQSAEQGSFMQAQAGVGGGRYPQKPLGAGGRPRRSQVSAGRAVPCILPICWRCLSTGALTLAGICVIRGLRRDRDSTPDGQRAMRRSSGCMCCPWRHITGCAGRPKNSATMKSLSYWKKGSIRRTGSC